MDSLLSGDSNTDPRNRPGAGKIPAAPSPPSPVVTQPALPTPRLASPCHICTTDCSLSEGR